MVRPAAWRPPVVKTEPSHVTPASGATGATGQEEGRNPAMRESYEDLELEVITFDAEDVITASPVEEIEVD